MKHRSNTTAQIQKQMDKLTWSWSIFKFILPRQMILCTCMNYTQEECKSIITQQFQTGRSLILHDSNDHNSHGRIMLMQICMQESSQYNSLKHGMACLQLILKLYQHLSKWWCTNMKHSIHVWFRFQSFQVIDITMG